MLALQGKHANAKAAIHIRDGEPSDSAHCAFGMLSFTIFVNFGPFSNCTCPS